ATSPTKPQISAATPVAYCSPQAVIVSCRVITTAHLVKKAMLEDAAGQRQPSSLIGGCSLQRLGSENEEPLTETEQCSDTTSDSETSSSESSVMGSNSMYAFDAPDNSITPSGRIECDFSGAATTRSSATDKADAKDCARTSFPRVTENTGQTGTMTDDVDGGESDRERSSRYLSKVRALSSECLKSLSWGETRGGDDNQKRYWRERSESEPRIPETSKPREIDFVDISGPPLEQEHPSSLHYRPYSCEASNPPPQVLQGFKLDYVKLDERSWLEVRDKHHRYGKNLRLYHKEWVRQRRPGGSFFSWLSTPEVQLEGCPRHELESDVVHYCRPEERENYALRLEVTAEGRAMLHTAKGEPVNSGPNAWLFVLRDRTIFATDKKTDPPRFHHSSFFGGGYVEAAGMLVAENGALMTLYPHSGHYRPTNSHLKGLLRFLRGLGVDLSAIQVDAQRVHKVARPDKRSERRVRKMDNPFMVSGMYLLDFFETKQKAWASSLFVDVRKKARERGDRLHRASTESSCEIG
ncbi:unnamed protein product, partial [Ascophyllum nodosum]